MLWLHASRQSRIHGQQARKLSRPSATMSSSIMPHRKTPYIVGAYARNSKYDPEQLNCNAGHGTFLEAASRGYKLVTNCWERRLYPYTGYCCGKASWNNPVVGRPRVFVMDTDGHDSRTTRQVYLSIAVFIKILSRTLHCDRDWFQWPGHILREGRGKKYKEGAFWFLKIFTFPCFCNLNSNLAYVNLCPHVFGIIVNKDSGSFVLQWTRWWWRWSGAISKVMIEQEVRWVARQRKEKRKWL
jgi:hypothetical protein